MDAQELAIEISSIRRQLEPLVDRLDTLVNQLQVTIDAAKTVHAAMPVHPIMLLNSKQALDILLAATYINQPTYNTLYRFAYPVVIEYAKQSIAYSKFGGLHDLATSPIGDDTIRLWGKKRRHDFLISVQTYMNDNPAETG